MGLGKAQVLLFTAYIRHMEQPTCKTGRLQYIVSTALLALIEALTYPDFYFLGINFTRFNCFLIFQCISYINAY